MDEESNVNDDTLNVAADDTNVSDTDTNDNTNDSAQASEDVDKLKEQNKKLFERAKKAEAEAKELKSKKIETPVVVKDDLSPKDLYALMDAKVPQGQIDEVIKASKILGKSIPETLKDGFVQARLKNLVEEQQTANATNTGTSKRTSPKLSDDQIVQNFMDGKEVDPEALALARMNLRKKR